MIVISFDSKSLRDDSGDSIIREWLNRARSRRQNSSVASNMSKDSQDSNAERVHEYGEASSTPSLRSHSHSPPTWKSSPNLGQRPIPDFAPRLEPLLPNDPGTVKPQPRTERWPTSMRGVRFAPMPTISAKSTRTFAKSTTSQTMSLLVRWLVIELGIREGIAPSTSLFR